MQLLNRIVDKKYTRLLSTYYKKKPIKTSLGISTFMTFFLRYVIPIFTSIGVRVHSRAIQ